MQAMVDATRTNPDSGAPLRALLQRAAHIAAAALDRLVPPRPSRDGRPLPPEWFKYPPF